MNAWLFGTCVLVALISAVAVLLDRQLDRGHEIRWHDRFYAPQLPVRRGRIIDVPSRAAPPDGRPAKGLARSPGVCGGRYRRGGDATPITDTQWAELASDATTR